MDLLRPIVEERLKQYNNNHDNESPGLPVRLAALMIVLNLTP